VPLASMTGFARHEGEWDGCQWTWEVRSVNARGLEVRCRLPAGFEGLEPAVRQRIGAVLKRGSITVVLSLSWAHGGSRVRINDEVLAAILDIAADLRQILPRSTEPSIDGLLALRGVIEIEDSAPTGEAREALDAALLKGFEEVVGRLHAVRGSEGARLALALKAQIDEIARLQRTASGVAAMQPDLLFARLKEQVQALADSIPALPPERLAQEAALLAVKADPREELDRLAAHVEAARELLAANGSVGRQLDFLCQELNREANTLCAKSASVDLTRLGLELKAVIDQVREQVQNIE
jgi:uncharacterized protein (TIGR00255 family)